MYINIIMNINIVDIVPNIKIFLLLIFMFYIHRIFPPSLRNIFTLREHFFQFIPRCGLKEQFIQSFFPDEYLRFFTQSSKFTGLLTTFKSSNILSPILLMKVLVFKCFGFVLISILSKISLRD